MRRLGQRPQRTLSRPTTLDGIGFLTGQRVRIGFRPAPPNTGLIFRRTDSRRPEFIPAGWQNVTGTRRRTTLGHAPYQVGLVEHVLASLAGLRIDNCLIELDAPEPPGFDGSAKPFVAALLAAGITAQPAERPVYTVETPITVSSGFASLTLHPAESDGLRVSYLLDYGHGSPIAQQRHTIDLTPESFIAELADCRTFVLDHEAEELQREGVGQHITPADVLVFGPRGPIDNRLRYSNEPARHKILDLVGDAALLGLDLRGHLVACRSGHPLNVELIRTLARRLAQHKSLPRLRVA
ncbi:MAG: UDP-3-O-acyl-N-acetylglucosamine deacetylase [Gemmataceae bacterium]